MINERTRMLVTTIQKLHHRGAFSNIQKILAKTHKADVATVLQMLAEEEATEIFLLEKRPDERAQILSYLEEDFQRRILAHVTAKEASELIENMDSDDAADLLGSLSDEESKNIIEGLAAEGSTEVVELMSYPPESAGGIMSSDFLAFLETATVDEVVQALQGEEAENKVTFYVYVVNRTNNLVGVVSLKQLLLSRKSTSLRELMVTNVISVKTDTDQEQVAEAVARYDFLSVPVVDEANCLIGVITVDDVIDVIKQEAEEDLLAMAQAGRDVDMNWLGHLKARLPWLSLTFLVGAASFVFIRWILGEDTFQSSNLWAKVCLAPLLLSLGAMAGNQVATVFMGAIRTDGRGQTWAHVIRELSTGLLWSVIFGGFTFGLSYLAVPASASVLALSVALHLGFTVVLGIALPMLINKLKFDPLGLTPPVYASLADIGAIFILFGLFNA